MIDMLEGEGTVEREFLPSTSSSSATESIFQSFPCLSIPLFTTRMAAWRTILTAPQQLRAFRRGEVGGGVHGANRLMGNSLLDINVFGRLAGVSAGSYVKGRADIGKLSVETREEIPQRTGRRRYSDG